MITQRITPTLFGRSMLAAALTAAFSQAAAQETVNDEAALADIQVSGSMYRTGDVPFLQARSAVALSGETLREQGVEKTDELGRYQAGFSNQVFGNDTNTNWFRLRGTEATQAADGMPLMQYGFFTPYTETYGMESVEITKGADALTFGTSQAGGLINYISKRPHKALVGHGEVKLHAGNRSQYGLAADYTGAFNADHSLRYRLVGSFRHTDGEWRGSDNLGVYFAPSLMWDIGERTQLTVLGSYQHDRGTPSSNFVPQSGSLVSTDRGDIDRRSNLGDPDKDTERNRQLSLGYEFSHGFGNGLTFDSRYRYQHSDNYHRGSYAYPAAYDANWTAVPFSASNGYTVARGVVFNDGDSRSHSLDNRLSWRFNRGIWDNTLVVGTDYRHQSVDALYTLFGSTSATNVFDPARGHNQTQDVSAAPQTAIRAHQLGFYLQNNLKINRQVALGVGIRHDRAENREHTSNQSVKDNHTSYSASAMYLGNHGIHPYYSYSESFRLPTGLSGNQTLYRPNTTRQHEIGIKFAPSALDLTASLALFCAKDRGALVSNSIGATVSSADPVQREGAEIQFQGQLTDQLSATFAYTYLKSVTETANGNDVRNPLIPKHSLAAGMSWNFDQGALNGLTLGAGVRHASGGVTSTGSLYSGRKVPGYTVLDLMARYRFGDRWTAQLNVDNVTDRRYLAGCDYYCYYGSGRNINASLSYRF